MHASIVGMSDVDPMIIPTTGVFSVIATPFPCQLRTIPIIDPYKPITLIRMTQVNNMSAAANSTATVATMTILLTPSFG